MNAKNEIDGVYGLTVDPNKVLGSISYIINLSAQKNYKPTQYEIVKTLFLADRRHLNEYGRPITFDNYVAMKHGPVPSASYDILKANEYTLRNLQIEDLPWKVEKKHENILRFSNADTAKYSMFLSDSDREVLESALETVRSLSFNQIRRVTHEDPAYLDAWQDNGDQAAYQMNLAMLFDDPNVELAQELVELSADVRAW